MPQQHTNEDLWPEDFGTTEPLPPLAILRGQAAALSERTNHALGGEVETATQGSHLVHAFFVTAPALDNYRYKVLSITHNKALLYPLEIYSEDIDSHRWEIVNEEQFRSALKRIFADPKIRKIIESMLAQARAAA